MMVEPILAEVFPEETAALRIQQVGLFTLILMLQGDDEPVTAARLAAVSGLRSSQVHRQLQKVLKIGLVERTPITAAHGRGRSYHLSIKHTPATAKLVKALLNGAKGSGRSQAGAKRGPK
jgi:predicted transcriptional regulator